MTKETAKTKVAPAVEAAPERSELQTKLLAKLAEMPDATTSDKIRALYTITEQKGEIARALSVGRAKPVLYQHVRNVIITPVKKSASKKA